MKQTVEREVIRAIAEVIPLADPRWSRRIAEIASERVMESAALKALTEKRHDVEIVEVEDETYGPRVSIPEEVADAWAARLVELYGNVEAAIGGAIGVDDDMLGDLIETLDLVSRHAQTTIGEFRRFGSRIPAAFEAASLS